MRQRLVVLATLIVIAATSTRSAPSASRVVTADGPFVISAVSTHGVGMISTWSDAAGHHADLGAWPEVGAFGCGFVYVDVDVRDGGTLTGKYSVRQSPLSDSFLDIYLLEPGVTWDPGTTWNESGTERCFRWDFPPGVVLLDSVDAWGLPGWETPEYDLSVPLDAYAHQTVRLVFRQWSWGEVYNEAIQTRIRNLPIAGQLKLFLDADGNFDPARPESDDTTYVPGSRLSDAASVALPQEIQVIAAFVDAAGAITAPPGTEQVTFRLEAVSAFEGMAMNAPDPRGSDSLPDLTLETAATLSFGSDNTARVTLKTWDYAARGRVVAAIGSNTADLAIPKDQQPVNGIADSGWVAADLTRVADAFSDPREDVDSDPFGTDPNGQEITGDGLGAIQEYRGFIVQGVHRRTNPQRKDLFIHSTHQLTIGDAVLLPVTLHLIEALEMSDLTAKMVNHLYRSGASEYPDLRPHDTVPFPAHQKALRVVEAGRNPLYPNAAGLTLGGGLGPNSVQGAIEIYRDVIRLISPPNNNITSVDPLDQPKTNQTLAHEIGHGVAIPHWRKDTSDKSAECSTLPVMRTRPLTVMVGCWFQQTKKLNDSKWNTIPHFYDQADLNRLRIRR